MRTPPRLPAYGPLALVLATLALLSAASGADHWLLAQIADPQRGFVLRHAAWAEQGLHRGGIWLIAAIAAAALGVLGAGLIHPAPRAWRREAAYLLACIALTTGAVSGLKDVTDRQCPWDLAQYGGAQPARAWFQASAPGEAPGRCFPGAHSSGAFSLLALGLALAARGHRAARPALAGALLLGLLYAGTQWLRGAHFPSHDLVSALIAWSVASLLARLILAPATLPLALQRPGWLRIGKGTALVLLAMLLTPAPPAQAAVTAGPAGPPVVREITYRGNEITRPVVMDRELAIAVGDPASPEAVERSRQAIQDLGLFRAVRVVQEPVAGGVRLVFEVEEKWYLLPYPRLSADSDGQNALGAELRWNNLWGLNHSLRTVVSSADRQEDGRGRQLSFSFSYRAPFVFASPYTISFSASQATTPVEDPSAIYDETIDEAQLLVSRKIGQRGSASQGWSAGSGLLWRRQDTSGLGAPDPYGDAFAWVAQLDYRDQRERIYSEVGTRFTTRFEIADQNLGSDYSYSRLTAQYKHAIPIGTTPHQTLEFAAEAGSANNGPPDQRRDFALGGTQGLRGYQRNSFQGDFYYLASLNYLRPLYWDWLRLVVGVEAGNVYDEADQMNTQVRWSLNLGLRARAPKLVNFEFELGVALPLDDDSLRFYGSRNGF